MASLPNIPPGTRQAFVNQGGGIERSWFRYLTDLLNSIPAFVYALVSGSGFWRSVDGTLQLSASAVNLGTGDVSGILADDHLPDTAITPSTYGDATTVAQVTFDRHGRAIAASGVPISFPVTSVANADGSVTVAPTTGDVDVSLPLSGVTPGSYTNANVTFNDRGIATAASNGTGGGSGIGVVTFATLPAATAGSFGFVSDANTTLVLGIGSVVAGGGANFVPVFADGSNWVIG